MKAKWIDEVAAILQSEAFASWLERLDQARKDLKNSRERHEELLTQVNLLEFRAELAHKKAIDTLERANVLEDESASLANEAAELENASFEVVSQFEMQRMKCTDLWGRLGAIDVDLEEGRGDRSKLDKQRQKLTLEYEREDQRKQRLWAEVENLWVKSIDKNLSLHEKRHKATLVRAEAESLFLRHEEEARQAAELRVEAERVARERQEREQILMSAREEARQTFDCLLNEDFLYWSAREDNKIVYSTPLIDDKKNYVVELGVGKLYRCPHNAGIDHLVEIDLATLASGDDGEGVAESDEAGEPEREEAPEDA